MPAVEEAFDAGMTALSLCKSALTINESKQCVVFLLLLLEVILVNERQGMNIRNRLQLLL